MYGEILMKTVTVVRVCGGVAELWPISTFWGGDSNQTPTGQRDRGGVLAVKPIGLKGMGGGLSNHQGN